MNSDPDSQSTWSPRAKWTASLLVTIHLFAVFVAPWSNPPPSTQLARNLADAMMGYIKFMSLDNGYRFFAPDPGPSHLVRYELRDADGATRSATFPDRERHWPRLLYHRHFMLSETLYGLSAPILDMPAAPSGMPPDERAAFESQKAQANALQASVARYLLRKNPAAVHVRLYSRTHEIPPPMEVLRGRQLDDPSLFEEFVLGDFER